MTPPSLPDGSLPVVRHARRDEIRAVSDLLITSDLGAEELELHFENFLVAELGGILVGSIGLERYGTTGLLRSAAVHAAYRGKGIGHLLVRHLVEEARGKGIMVLILLTTTAEAFFAANAFVRVPRDQISGAVLQSAQFRYACPSTAAVMKREL